MNYIDCPNKESMAHIAAELTKHGIRFRAFRVNGVWTIQITGF